MKSYAGSFVAALALLSSTSLAAVLKTDVSQGDPDAFVRHSQDNGALKSEGVDTYDGVPLADIPKNIAPQGRAAIAAGSTQISKTGWTATASDYQPGNEPAKAIDGNSNTFWHSQYNPLKQLPHTLTIDMKKSYLINTIAVQPRQDSSPNGHIGQHMVQLSTDGTNFGPAKVIGTWRDDSSTKTSIFEATNARYIRLTAMTEAGNRGSWSSVAEFNVYTAAAAPHSYPGIAGGEWSPTIDFPIVPVAAAIEVPTGNVLTWSSFAADSFGGSPGGKTVTSTYDFRLTTVSQRIVTETNHDMFCPGINMDSKGRVFVTGGNQAEKVSYWTPVANTWTAGPRMIIPRGYQAQSTVADGRTFVIGGSWSGGEGNKNGEIYSPSTNSWTSLTGALVAPMLTNDAQGVYRADNHAMLFSWKSNYVFQAGPSKKMNWYNTAGTGGVGGAGTRASDGDAMCGTASMYDAVAGKILVTGGAPSYQNVDATANAHILTIGNPGSTVSVQTISGMYNKRIFHNGVVMPNGNVFIVGGQVYGQPFSDDTAIFQPEIFVASTGHFVYLPNINVPRVYHSVALLLADGTIFSGGGGLCGACATNHFDGQVYTPGYLFNGDGSKAARPVINTASTTVNPGGTITATTGGAVSSWALVRLGTATHTVNTDQRRIPLTATAAGNTYTMKVPNDYGILIPGYYYLFAMNSAGVPSVAKYVQVPR